MKNFLLTLTLASALAMAESAGGLQWKAPAAWQAQPERPMRAATYTVPKAAGDTENGECAVFYFGQGQGGDAQANIRRWIGQFQAPNGGPADALAKTTNGKLGALTVTRIDLSGTYKPSGGPMMQSAGAPKPNYRLLGAIVEGPQGSVFFKFTGPAKTVAANQAAFEAMLRGLK